MTDYKAQVATIPNLGPPLNLSVTPCRCRDHIPGDWHSEPCMVAHYDAEFVRAAIARGTIELHPKPWVRAMRRVRL